MTKPLPIEIPPPSLPIKGQVFRDGEPCNHLGCLSHVSHPCEGCGRIGGYEPIERHCGADISYWERVSYWDRCLQAVCRTLAHENRVKDECLEIAMEALKKYGNMHHSYARRRLAEIERRLAELELEPDALPCGHPREAATGEAQEVQ